jgi:hypothetical protein
MSKHTPTPWKIVAPRDGWISIHGPRGEEIIEVNASDGLDDPTYYPDRDNAAFIVKACNEYDELVKAVRALVQVTGTLSPTHSADALAAHVQGLAVLAKAEGRTP